MDADRRELALFGEAHAVWLGRALAEIGRRTGVELPPLSLLARLHEAVELVLGPVEARSGPARTVLRGLHLADLVLASAALEGDAGARASLARRLGSPPAADLLDGYRATVALTRYAAALDPGRSRQLAAADAGTTIAAAAPLDPRRWLALDPRLRVALALEIAAHLTPPEAEAAAAAPERALRSGAITSELRTVARQFLAEPPPSACPDPNLTLGWLDGFPEIDELAVGEHVARCRACLGLIRAAGPAPGGRRRAGRRWPARAALLTVAAAALLAVLAAPQTEHDPGARPATRDRARPSAVPQAEAPATGADVEPEQRRASIATGSESPGSDANATPGLVSKAGRVASGGRNPSPRQSPVRSPGASPTPTSSPGPVPGPPRPEQARLLAARLAAEAATPVLRPEAGTPAATPAALPPTTTTAGTDAVRWELRQIPGSSRAARMINAAVGRYRRGDEEAALQVVARALLLEPALRDGHWNAALLSERLRDTARAHAHWRRFLELAPGSAEADAVHQRMVPRRR